MLPLKITLDGFMSYREPATLSFEGASLWMLAGANGAGKSSVFDAMRWMLFNRHRGGAQGHEALIHHDKTKMRVAFDLEIASGRFRLLRTLSRGGKSSWQIEKLVPGLTQESTEKVPETDMRDGYNRWIAENIGLSDETFGAAFYLAQGRGDAILSAKPEDRYEMLAEIVDLSAYAHLHERVKTRAGELESAARTLRLQFEAAPPIEVSALAARRAQADELARRSDELQARLAHWRGLAPWAKQWQSLQKTRGELETERDATHRLLESSAQIERDAARRLELQARLPPLEKWLCECGRAAHNQAQIVGYRANFEAAEMRRAAEEAALEAAQTARQSGEAARQNHQTARLAVLTRQNELAPRVAQAEALQKARHSERDLEVQLEVFPAEGEARIEALESQIEAAQASQSALAVLRRYDRQRGWWREAMEGLTTTQREKDGLESRRPELENQLQQGAQWRASAAQKRAEALEHLVASQARASDASAAQSRFEAVQDEPTCHFCGQILTPEHAARETARLQKALHQALETQSAAQGAFDDADAALNSAEARWETQRRQLSDADAALLRNQTRRSALAAALEQARGGAGEALRELDPEFAARFGGDAARFGQHAWDDARVEAALGQPFPLESDFSVLQTGAEELSGARKLLQSARQSWAARGKIAARLEAVRLQIEPLQAEFAGESTDLLAAESAQLKRTLAATNRALDQTEAALKAALKREAAAQKALDEARREGAAAQNRLAGLEAARSEIERALEELRAAQPALQADFARDLSALGEELAREKAELARLESSDLRAQIEKLNGARQRELQLQAELSGLKTAVAQIPPDARRAESELKSEIEAQRRQAEALSSQNRALEVEIAGMERLLNEKSALQKTLLNAENDARQHRTLADLLGPYQLQRFLLREAENGIVDEANATLDRISSGTLRLELRADDDEVAGARKGVPKVLDLAVWQESGEGGERAGQSRAMLPAFLSGSQRFRVAVALALGIGRFATRGQGASKLESVIIDEGFGSLDKIGRAEMIEELRALGDELRRVILVSHQEEFIEAFPNRYLIEHDGTASTARLSVG